MDKLELKAIDLSFVKESSVAVQQYVEFIVNGQALSTQIEKHFKLEKPLFSKFTSVLGTMELTNFDRLKVHQLLAHTTHEKDVEELFPAKHFDQEPILTELKLNNVLIYCCAECADYRCSGVFAKISKTPKSFKWSIEHPIFNAADLINDSPTLDFEFDQETYHKIFKDYVLGLDDEED